MTVKGNLLLVDDEPLIVHNIAILLKEHADQIYKAFNGQEAIDLFTQYGEEIHCIVCDINMPVIDGMKVIEEVKKKDPNLPFIFFSAYGEEKFMIKALEFGVFDFIIKPDLEKLEEVVCKALIEGVKFKNGGHSKLSTINKLMCEVDSLENSSYENHRDHKDNDDRK